MGRHIRSYPKTPVVRISIEKTISRFKISDKNLKLTEFCITNAKVINYYAAILEQRLSFSALQPFTSKGWIRPNFLTARPKTPVYFVRKIKLQGSVPVLGQNLISNSR
ncbi:hypothetical protein [Leptospira borgpetersenii]|uniref:hypothetical protein n=1 Tax=Leptospira borgpetersenii TaxID=174 RepID=UPI0007A7364B|nr:hypothetical protein [Leptospira borgpetersenii]